MRAILAVTAAALLLVSCRSLGPESASSPPARVAFYVESAGLEGRSVVLPQSGVRIGVRATPVVTAREIVDVQVTQTEMGPALVFRFTSDAMAALNTASRGAADRRLVLTVDEAAIGARRLEGIFGNAPLTFYVEVPETELPALAARLNAGAAGRRRTYSP